MKHKYEAYFLPDHIDEQIDNYLKQQQASGQPASPSVEPAIEKAAQQAIQTLQKHFASPEEDSARLQRVWQRLAPQQAALEIQALDTEKDIPPLITDIQQAKRKRMSSKSTQLSLPSQPLNAGTLTYRQPRFSRFSVLIAVACTIILLIGGVIGLQILHQGKSKPGPAASTAAPIKETAGIYYNATLTRNVYRLDPVTHKVLWHSSILTDGPIIAKNGLLYAFSTGNDRRTTLYALNAADGSIRWSTPVITQANPTDPQERLSVLIVTNDMVYFGISSTSQGYSVVHALSAMTGTEVWQYRLNNTGIMLHYQTSDVLAGIALQAATNDVLYVTKSLGPYNQPETTLYALDVKHQGQELWHQAIMPGSLPDSGGTIINGVLCLSSTESNDASRTVYGYDASTGIQKWSMPVGGVVHHLVDSNGILYIGIDRIQSTQNTSVFSDKGDVYAIRPQDGSTLWHYVTQDGVSDPVIEDGTVYFITHKLTPATTTLNALDATTGRLRWSQSATDGPGFTYGLVASNNFLYLPIYGGVKVFHIPDGSSAGTFYIPTQSYNEPFTLTIVP